jgi:hypothetical protein
MSRRNRRGVRFFDDFRIYVWESASDVCFFRQVASMPGTFFSRCVQGTVVVLILGAGIYRQRAQAEGLFQPEGLMTQASRAVERWWNELQTPEDAQPAAPDLLSETPIPRPEPDLAPSVAPFPGLPTGPSCRHVCR